MNSFPVFIISLSLSVCFSNHTDDCKSVHTGKFLDKTKTTTITRTETEQTDVTPSDGWDWLWDVKWLNECEYLMIFKQDRSTNPKHIYKLGDTLRVKILRVSEDKYDWQAWYKKYTLTGFNYRVK